MRILVWLMLLALPVVAADLSDDELREKGLALSVELGFNRTTGNSETRGYHTALVIDEMLGEWRNRFNFEHSFKKDSGNVSEERYFFSDQLNHHYSDSAYVLGRAAYENDRFNGLDNAVTVSLGMGYLILEADKYRWDVEGGPGYRYNAAQDERSEVIMRLASSARYDISDTSRLRQQFSVEAGKENTISRSETSLSASIIGQLAMKLSFVATHQSQPADGSDGKPKKARDSKMLITALYDF
jgi:putative salt-induced outer membrane protein